jgi:hypothetical protein
MCGTLGAIFGRADAYRVDEACFRRVLRELMRSRSRRGLRESLLGRNLARLAKIGVQSEKRFSARAEYAARITSLTNGGCRAVVPRRT